MLEVRQVTELLRGKRFKVTPQRLAVYEALAKQKHIRMQRPFTMSFSRIILR